MKYLKSEQLLDINILNKYIKDFLTKKEYIFSKNREENVE